MQAKPYLVEADASRALDAAARYAKAHGWKVAIAVVDDGGQLLALKRLDGAAPITAQVAFGKARTAALSHKPSGVHEAAINGGRTALLSMSSDVMMEGGVPIVVDGMVVGAVGVSGAVSSEDAQVAQAGADSAAA